MDINFKGKEEPEGSLMGYFEPCGAVSHTKPSTPLLAAHVSGETRVAKDLARSVILLA